MKAQSTLAMSTRWSEADLAQRSAPRLPVSDPSPFIARSDLEFALALEFSFLPSWNDLPGDLFSRMSFVERWRREGRKTAITWARKTGIKTEEYLHYRKVTKKNPNPKAEPRERLTTVYLERPVKLVCRIWRPDRSIFDAHNLALKFPLDGFVDSRLLYGDDTQWIRSVEFGYEGIDRSLELSAAEKNERRAMQAERKLKGQPAKRVQTRARFRLEFFLFPKEEAVPIQPALISLLDDRPPWERVRP